MRKSHEALVSLSHHHHHALVVALKLTKAGEPESKWSVEEAIQDTLDFWTNGGQAHFREEEEILLPTFAQVASVDLPEIKQMLIDHVVIRAWKVQFIEPGEDPLPLMKALGERFQSHVRLEERHVFPMIEDALSEAEMNKIQGAFHLNFKPKLDE